MAVTQSMEKAPTFEQKFNAVKASMMGNTKIKKRFTEDEIDVMIEQSCIEYANDKIEFMFRNIMKRNSHGKLNKFRQKMGLSPISIEDFEKDNRKTLKADLAKKGFSFALSKEKKEIYDGILKRQEQEAIEEKTKLTAEALKKILTS